MHKQKRSEEKRNRIIDAARNLILRDGLRATTMEAIARDAGIAKPTLYAQFTDKNAVFAAVFEAFLAEVIEAAEIGFELEGKVWEQIGEVLARQHLAITHCLNGSPHAHELMTEPNRSGFKFEPRHFATEAKIEQALSSAGASDAEPLTRLLAACAYGISLKTSDPLTMANAIRLMAHRIIEPELCQKFE